MDLSVLLQGISAAVDAVSIGVTPQVLTEDKNDANQARRNTATADEKIDRKRDREILAKTRQSEMKKLREERQRSRTHTHTLGR